MSQIEHKLCKSEMNDVNPIYIDVERGKRKTEEI